jgi:predicted TIM-barrel fold metal-dependent hydrolase
MIFDAHLHLSPALDEPPAASELMGGLAISRSVDENDLYVRAARRLGLRCAVFVGGTAGALDRVLSWIESGQACAYDHVELVDRFDPSEVSPILDASCRAGRPFVLHLSHHGKKRTPAALVSSCLDYLTENFPQLKVVVAHLASENCHTALRFADANANLFFDISRLAETSERLGSSSPVDLLRSLADTIPVSRIIFGTDQVSVWNPVNSIEYSAIREVFSDQDSREILASNGLTVFAGSSEK